MNKIKTIFDRDWQGDRGVIDDLIVPYDKLRNAKATEKVDGTNIRITMRNKNIVRIEKRKNPTKFQKHLGISDPWYTDIDYNDPCDKYIINAAKDLAWHRDIPDGEWSGEALGPKIQGNPLKLKKYCVLLFSIDAPVFTDVPLEFNTLKEWLPRQKSQFGDNCGIEGIVWHCEDGEMYKIKTKDFK